MDTVIVSNSQFYSHFPRRIPQGTVNAESVLIRLDSEWDNLTVRIHWLNVASNVERKPLLERDQPNTIPWEVLTDLGELRMGLVGLDGETVIKPTIWLTYGYVSDGVDPESGSDPQPPTPSWEQQMVAQATQANQAAQDAKEYAQQVAESIENAGPYAEEAKKAAEAAKASETAAKGAADTATQQATKAQEAVTSIGNAVDQAQSAATAAGSAQQAAETAKEGAAQSAGTAQSAAVAAVQSAGTAQDAATKAGEYMSSAETAAGAATDAAVAAGKLQEGAQTAAQEAANARDQATTAATTAQDHATAASTAKDAAEQAATTAGTAQAGAAQSAKDAAGAASAAQAAQQAAETAAAVLPKPTKEDAGKVPTVNPEGDGYIFGKLSKKRRLIAKYTHTANGVVKLSDLDMETGVFTCSEPHKLSEGKPMYLRPLSGCNPVNIPVEIPLANPSQWGRGRLKAHIVDDYSFKLYKESSDDCLTYTSEYNSRVNVDFFTFEFDLKSVRISNINCNSVEIYACGDVSGGYFGSAFHLVGLQGSKEEIVRITEEDSAVKTGAFLDGQEGQVSKSLVFVGKATFKDDSIYAIFDYMSHVVALTSYAKQPSNSTPYIRRAKASTSKTVGLTNYRVNRVPGEKVDIITGFSPCSSEAIPYNGFYIEVWGYDDDK